MSPASSSGWSNFQSAASQPTSNIRRGISGGFHSFCEHVARWQFASFHAKGEVGSFAMFDFAGAKTHPADGAAVGTAAAAQVMQQGGIAESAQSWILNANDPHIDAQGVLQSARQQCADGAVTIEQKG